MDLNYSPEDEQFRIEAREYLESIVPDEVRRTIGSRNTMARRIREAFYAAMMKKGWMAPGWPKQWGGAEMPLVRQVILREEMGRVGSPNFDFGIVMIGPLLMEFGTPEQQQRFLPKIARAEEFWCQGYSEPGAGSDLAALSTRAVIDGDDFVLNGRKIWTSTAHEADWMFLLVRTDAGVRKRQEGISFLLLDLKSPGIEILRIHQISDESHFCEVVLNDVRVPRKNLLGPLNGGWTLGKRLLSYERTGFVSGDLVRQTLESLIESSRLEQGGGEKIRNGTLRTKFARASMELDAARYLGYRSLTRTLRGEPPGPEASIVKVFVSENQQRISDLSHDVQGPKAQLWRDPNFSEADRTWPLIAVASRSVTLAGGTSEVQRNIIAEGILGLPRE